jgi:hypothetical protein
MWRRGPPSHPSIPARRREPPASCSGPRSPPRPARPRHQLADAPTPQPAGARPAPAAKPPRPEGRCAAPRGRAGGGDGGSPPRLPSSGLPLGPRRHAWSAPPVHTPSAPPRPPPQSTPLPRTAGPVGPPHYIPSDPGWAGGRCAALRWPRKFSGGAGLAIQSGPPRLSRSGRYADRCPRRARARRLEPAVAGASQATRGPSARGRPPRTHSPAISIEQTGGCDRAHREPKPEGPPTDLLATSRPACAIERLSCSWQLADAGGRWWSVSSGGRGVG